MIRYVSVTVASFFRVVNDECQMVNNGADDVVNNDAVNDDAVGVGVK